MGSLKIITHLKPESYYHDLYDRHTVEECRRLEKMCDEVIKDHKEKAKKSF